MTVVADAIRNKVGAIRENAETFWDAYVALEKKNNAARAGLAENTAINEMSVEQLRDYRAACGWEPLAGAAKPPAHRKRNRGTTKKAAR